VKSQLVSTGIICWLETPPATARAISR